ncbi:MAG TPA: RHS repeat-associated core domain-containing protein, partial [Xanthomarina sp.]|nr:RHS repeat-associated core domain-containing protein [Xanthomarina sp.]
ITTTLTSQPWEETFVHDNMNRLTQITGPTGIEAQTYDTRGRINQNNQIGDYNYTGNSYRANSVDLNSNAQDYYQDHPLQNITYNAFKQPVSIQEENHDRINFSYNTFGQRSIMYYGSNDVDKENRPYRKYYSSIAPMEIKYDVVNGVYEFFTYLGGDQYTAPVVYKQEGTAAGAMLYLHRDYLGSILAITDQDKNVLEKRHFSAWGSLEYFEQNGNAISLDFGDMPNMLLDRGYTGHEHLYGTKLIHMNGRLYDPVVRRFLSPDNYVQDPFNTQNFNRYGYVLNSPLKYNDPSGEMGNCVECNSGGGAGWGALIGAVVGTVATNWDEWRIGDWLGNNFDSALSEIDGAFTAAWKSIFPGSRDAIVYNNALQGFSNSQSVKGWQNEGIGSSGFENMYNASKSMDLAGPNIQSIIPMMVESAGGNPDFSGFWGTINYIWTGGNEDGIHYDWDGNPKGLAPTAGIIPVGPGKVIKAAESTKKVVVIGEDMLGRVIPYAEKYGYKYFKPRSTNPANWMKNQVQWIRRQIKDPWTTIIDIGPKGSSPISKYYKKELEMILKWLKL